MKWPTLIAIAIIVFNSLKDLYLLKKEKKLNKVTFGINIVVMVLLGSLLFFTSEEQKLLQENIDRSDRNSIKIDSLDTKVTNIYNEIM